MAVEAYEAHFTNAVRGRAGVVLHNADLYPRAYQQLRAITYVRTGDPVSVAARLREPDESSALQLSYDASALEPASRERSTYALQEYFVPVRRFTPFVDRLRTILTEHDTNVVNVSVRHVTADPGSVLAWAREEVFGFVLYYRHATDAEGREGVGRWTRALIEAALAEGGTFYLPYQLHATEDQFRRAYPRYEEFLRVKRRVDPANKFRNEFWNKYGWGRRQLPAALGVIARRPFADA
jgi:FAD/FMN-containing dehydrogenase